MKKRIFSSLATLLLGSPVYGDQSPLVAQQVSLPSVNTDELGGMVAVGQFDAISVYQYEGEQNTTSSQSTGTDRIYSQTNETYLLSQQQLDGNVFATCTLGNSLFFSGNFSSVGTTNASSGVASLDMNSGQVTALGSSDDIQNGLVRALYCDSDEKVVYAGGDFTFNSTKGAAVWSTDDKKWDSPLFEGFSNSSVVNSIVKFNDSLIFGGVITGLSNSSFLGKSNNDNSSIEEINQKQWVSFNAATISAEGTGSGDPSSIVCPGASWQLSDGRQGTWRADWPYQFTPSRMRLYNAKGGNGVKTFQFVAFPINGIMNLTYTDPSTNKNVTCDQSCPLPSSSNAEYIDFYFVNQVSMDGIQLYLFDHYGSAAGLSGIELFQDDLVTFANQDYNKLPSCLSYNGDTGSADLSGSGWTSMDVQGAAYMSSTVSSAGDISSLEATFHPNITVKGNYSVMIYTPSCVADGTCSSRGGVNVTVNYAKDKDPVSTIIYQTQDNEKYDTIYTGKVDPIKGDFKPSVVVKPADGQNAPYNMVAERVLFSFLNGVEDDDDDDDDDDSSSSNSTSSHRVKLNGLFEFSHDNFTKLSDGSIPVGNTTINKFGGLSLDEGADIRSIVVTKDGDLAIGGNFTGDKIGSNFAILKKDDSSFSAVDGKGLNGIVNKLVSLSDSNGVVVAGKFSGSNESSSTNGLNNIAQYDVSGDKWKSFEEGVTGEVTSVAEMYVNGTDALGVTGNFKSIKTSNSSTIDTPSGFGIWMVDAGKWIQELANSSYVSGRLSASQTHDNSTFYFGSLQMLQINSPGAATVQSNMGLSSMPFRMITDQSSNSSTSSANHKRAVNATDLNSNSSSPGTNTVYTAAFANGTGTILGGQFLAQNDGGDTFQNLVVVSDSNVDGLPQSIMSSDSVVYTLLVEDDQVVVGGKIEGQNSGGNLRGILFYDLNTNNLSDTQPPGVSGNDGIVTSVAMRPNSNNLVVMGSFTEVGSLACSTLCIYDMKSQRWTNPESSGLTGSISQSAFLNSSLVFFSGNLTLNNTDAYFGSYNFDSGEFKLYTDLSDSLPGPVNTFALNGDGTESMFASGSDSSGAYLAYWNDSNWTRIDNVFADGTSISDVKVLDLSQKHNSTSMLPEDQLLIVSGDLTLNEYGKVSSAMYDGDKWQPLYLTVSGSGGGMIRSLVSENNPTFSSTKGDSHLARGFVVLISLAIAVGLTLLIVLLGLLVSYMRKRRMGYQPAPNRVSEVDMTQTVPPASLFEEMGGLGARKVS